MCVAIEQRSRRERILFAIANFSLAAGLALPYVVHSNALSANWLDALRGLLLGVSMGMNLKLFGIARRTRHDAGQTRPAS